MSKSCCSSGSKKQVKATGKMDPVLIGVVAVTLAILGGVLFFGTKIGATAQVNPDSQVEMQAESRSHDWGTIDINGGTVSKTFSIKNGGENPLKLYDIKTSCMCTTAQLKTANRSSKKFGMHEKTVSVFEVAPGETAELLVEFDPAYHGPSGVGLATRVVSMSTNDPAQPELSFNLRANVVKQ